MTPVKSKLSQTDAVQQQGLHTMAKGNASEKKEVKKPKKDKKGKK